MAKFWGNKILDEKLNKRLEEELGNIAKPDIHESNREFLKDSILKSIKDHELLPSPLRRLVYSIKKVRRAVRLPAQASAMLKARILNYISVSSTFHYRPVSAPVRFKGARVFVSGALLAVFILATISVFPFQAHTAKANTYLGDIAGDVLVLRDNNLVEGHENLSLEEGDVVMTKEESFATIFFFEDSQSRLNENTNLEIRRLYMEPLNPLVTKTELYLKKGRIWAKVKNLVDEDSNFSIDTEKAQASVANKGAFDLQVESESTQLIVFDNVVEFTPTNVDQSKTVVAGYKAEVSNETMGNVDMELIDESELIENEGYDWIEENLSKDEEYDDQLFVEKEELFESEQINGSVPAVSLDNPAMEEQRVRFLNAYKDFINGEALLVRGARLDALKAFNRFERVTLDIISMLPDFYAEDEFNTGILRNIIEEKIAIQLKDLSAFIPGDKLYRAKEVMQGVQVALAETAVLRTQVQLSQAKSKLLEIQELLKDGKTGLAGVLLDRYRMLTDEFVLMVVKGQEDELRENLVPLFKQQIEQLKVLAALEESLTDDQYFQNKVANVRDENMIKLMAALEKLPGSIPRDLIVQLKDIFDTYFVDSSEGKDIIIPVFEKLLSRPYDSSEVPSPDEEIPNELGVVMIVTGESSSDPLLKVDEDSYMDEMGEIEIPYTF